MHKWCLVIIGLWNGLTSVWCQANTWTNATLLPMGPREKSSDNWFNTWGWDKMAAILDNIFKAFSWYENVQISTNISPKFVPYGPVDYNRAVVQIMAWRQPGNKPLSQPMMVSLFDLDAIKSWINISSMGQTRFFLLRTALLCESAYGCMTTRWLIIQWSQKTLIIDIIIPWILPWDQRPKQFEYYMNGIRKQHVSNQRESLSQSCSCTAMKTDYQTALYKQQESMNPYLSEYNLGPFTNMD